MGKFGKVRNTWEIQNDGEQAGAFRNNPERYWKVWQSMGKLGMIGKSRMTGSKQDQSGKVWYRMGKYGKGRIIWKSQNDGEQSGTIRKGQGKSWNVWKY